MKKLSTKILIVLVVSVLLCSSFLFFGCDDGKYVKEDQVYQLSSLELINNTLSLAATIITIDEESLLTLRPDGTLTLKIAINGLLITQAIDTFFKDLDLSALDLNGIVDTYAKTLFPGFTLNDVPASLELLEKSLGIKFTGIDFSTERGKVWLAALKNGTLPAKLDIPNKLGIEVNCQYYLKTVVAEDGKTYKAVYMQDVENYGDPFVLMTIAKNNDGVETISFDIEFLSLHYKAAKVK